MPCKTIAEDLETLNPIKVTMMGGLHFFTTLLDAQALNPIPTIKLTDRDEMSPREALRLLLLLHSHLFCSFNGSLLTFQ